MLVSKDQNILSFDSSNHERTQHCCHVNIPKAQQKLNNITNLSLNSSNQKVFWRYLLPENAHERGQWQWKQSCPVCVAA